MATVQLACRCKKAQRPKVYPAYPAERTHTDSGR